MNFGVLVGEGNLDGKGVYAARNFAEGEIVIQYNLTLLTDADYVRLPNEERMFVHKHKDKLYLYGEPERYVNHSERPNTHQDLKKQQDIALRDIKKGEAITTDSTKDDL